MKQLKITVIGTGALGKAIAFQLKKHDFNVTGITSRTKKEDCHLTGINIISLNKAHKLDSDVYIFAVPDKAIAINAKKIAKYFNSKKILIHLSGCLSSDILKINKYCLAASAHPIGSFKHFESAVKTIQNVFWTLEGDKKAIEFMKLFIKKLGGKYYEIDKKEKPLYHTACTLASSGLLSLIKMSSDLLNTVGYRHACTLQDKKNSLAILWPLISSSLENLQSAGFPNGLTGPWARKDKKTIKIHKDALKNYDKNILKLYNALGVRQTPRLGKYE